MRDWKTKQNKKIKQSNYESSKDIYHEIKIIILQNWDM